MRILDKYLIKQHVAPFAFSMVAMTGFMLMNQIARLLPMLLGKGLPKATIVEFFLLTIPSLVAMTISMSVLVARCNHIPPNRSEYHSHRLCRQRSDGLRLEQGRPTAHPIQWFRS